MGTSLDQQTVNRLAFSRHLLDKARREAARPEPYSSEALLTMHDAAELFLVLCAEHLNVILPRNVQFDGYWSEIESQAGVTLPLQAQMKNVNKARVQLKHHFQSPARNDLEQHLARTAQFFEEATPIVFAVDLADVSVVGLVRDPDVRRWIQRAEGLRSTNETQALAACVMAHRTAILVYRRDQWGRQATPFDVTTTSVSLDSETCSSADEIEWFAGEVSTALQDISASLETLAVGLDLDRLEQLRQYWPSVHRRHNKLEVLEKSSQAEDRPIGIIDASITWVTEAALHLQERLRPF